MIFNPSTLPVLLAVTITAGTADALSIHRPSLRISYKASALNLTPRDDLSDYGKQKQQSEQDESSVAHLAVNQETFKNWWYNSTSERRQQISCEETVLSAVGRSGRRGSGSWVQ